MEPWIIDKIMREKKAREERARSRPRLPVLPPVEQPTREDEQDKCSVVDYEIKF